LTTGVIICFLIVSSLYGCSNKTENLNEDKVVKIGFLAPLTGDIAFWGRDGLDAMNLAIEDAGATKYKYQIIAEDSAFDAKKAVLAANRLIHSEKVNLILPYVTVEANVVSPIANQEKIMSLSPGATDDAILQGEYNFKLYPSGIAEAEMLAKYLVEKHYRRVAILFANSTFFPKAANILDRDLQKNNVEAFSESVQPDVRNFRTVILKILNKSPDIIVIELLPPQLELFYKHLREKDTDIPITSIESFERTQHLELFEGFPFSSATSAPNNLIDRFKAKYHRVPDGSIIWAYEAMRFLISVQEQEASVIRATEWVPIIRKTNTWESPYLGRLNIDEKGQVATNAVMRIIKEGRFVTLDDFR